MSLVKRALSGVVVCSFALRIAAQEQSEHEHVPPEAPDMTMPEMTYREMVRVMEMDDRQPYHSLVLEELEGQRTDHEISAAWDAALYWGNDYDKLAFKSEGEGAEGKVTDARAELAWDRIISRWWSGQLGVRHDWGDGPERDWAAAGVRGLAPYFFDLEATFYLGEGGRTALRFAVDYDLLLTQRLILQPKAGLNAYGKDDPARGVMSGLSDIELGVRLRYEFRREIAPYVGISWASALGETSDLQRANGADPSQWQVLAGVRIAF